MPSELGLSSTAWSTVTAKHFLQETLQFSGPSKFILHDGSIPRHYKLLLPDKQIASSESPDTHNGDGSPYDESSTTTSSPLSYTKELTNVSSPLTPLSDARRSKSKSPSQLAVVKSKFLEEEEDEQEKTLTNGSSRREEAAEDVPARKEGNPLPSTSKQFIGPQMPETKPSPAKVNGEKEEYSTPLNSPYKPKVMTIKIGNVTMAKKELTQPLVPYGEESSSGEESDEENTVQVRVKPSPMKPRAPSPQTIIGPLKPSKLPLPETKPIVQKRSAEGLTTPPVSKRKRLLSERGEKEMAYPIMDKSTISAWNWSNFQLLTGRPRGVGLYNSSNDCFLNAILQVVTHTPPLCRYLIERHDSRSCTRPNNQCVACGLAANHIRRALGTGSPFQATWIRSHLRRIFPSHIHGMQEDAHELLALLLDAIDPPITSSKNNIINGMNTKPSTPIEQIFGGTLRNQVTCEACGSVYTNYERIRELNLAIRKMRPDADHTKISYLIDLYFRDENVASFDCKHCAKKTTATRKTKILRPPAVLLVQLKRFNAYGQKIRLPVTPEIDIDLTKFMFDGAPPSCTEYVLTSVVEHLGATVDHGHYIAYCRGFDHKQWFHFDDETVTGVSSQKVSSSNPYLLVYSRREDMPFHSGKKLENGTIRIPKSPYQKQNGFTTKYNGYSNGNFSRQPFRI